MLIPAVVLIDSKRNIIWNNSHSKTSRNTSFFECIKLLIIKILLVANKNYYMIELRSYKKEIEWIFEKNNIDKEEVNILFSEALNLSLSELVFKKEITKNEKSKIDYAIKKRLTGMPIQKIFKRAYFYGYTFFVNNNVLCPRPETELLVEEVLKNIEHAKNYEKIIKNKQKTSKKLKILDLCTGSGCIAIATKKNCDVEIFASDISKKALYVARKNAKYLDTKIHFIYSNMFENIKNKFDIIVSNPPYIKGKDIQNLDIEVKNYDPVLALDGGDDGLNFYRIISNQSKNFLNQNGVVILEVGLGQANAVIKIMSENGFDCEIKKDYNNIERIIVCKSKD